VHAKFAAVGSFGDREIFLARDFIIVLWNSLRDLGD